MLPQSARDLDVPLRSFTSEDATEEARPTGLVPRRGGAVSRIFLGWVFPLLRRSADVEKLEVKDLFEMESRAKPDVLYAAFIGQWREELRRQRSTGRQPWPGMSLLRVMLRLHYRSLWLLWLARLVQVLLDFSYPLFLNRLVTYVSDPTMTLSTGLLYCVTLFAAMSLDVIIDQNTSNEMQSLGLRVRSCMISAIFRKVLVLRQDSLLSFSSGQLNNLITTDVDKVRRVVRFLHILLLTAPVRLTISVFSLHRLVGNALFIGLGWMGFVILLNPIMMWLSSKLEDKQQSKTDERVRKATEVISSIQVVKCYAWEEPATAKVEGARRAELLSMWRLYCLYTVFEGLWSSVIPITTAVMFAAYSLLNPDTPLTAAQAFTAMSLLQMVQEPLFTIPWVLNLVVEAQVAGKRMERLFFLTETDLPAIGSIGSFLAERAAEDADVLDQDAQEHAGAASKSQETEASKHAVELSEASFVWPERPQRDAGSRSDEDEEEGADQSNTSENARTGSSEFQLSDITLRVPKGSFVAVVGETGSGKTSLLQAILGEMPAKEGAEGVAEVSRRRPIAFVPQQPWIFNSSVRNNILFGDSFVEARYAECIRCCSLEQDLELLKSGDQTKVGEKGIALSGGQKARVCLARAAYKQQASNIFLLDDPYSALDAHVARNVHEAAVKGLLAKKTRIVAMNRLEFARDCDILVVVENGGITCYSSYEKACQQSSTLKKLLTAQGLDAGGSDEPVPDSPQGVSLQRAISAGSSAGAGEEAAQGSGSEDEEAEDDENEEERASGHMKKEVFFYYLRNMGGPCVISMLAAFYLGSEVLNLSLPIWLATWTSAAPTHDEMNGYLKVYVCLSLAVILLMTTRDMAGNILGFRAARRLHEAMFAAVLRAPMSFFQDTPQGRIINRFSKDMSEIDKDLIWQLIYTLVPVLGVLGNFAMVGGIAYISLLLFTPAFWLYYKLWKYYNKAALDMKRISKVMSSPVYDHFNNLCRENAISVVRAFQQVEKQCQVSDAHILEQQRPDYSQLYLELWFSMRIEHLGCVLVFLVSLFVVFGRGRLISEGAAALALTFSGECSDSLQSLIGQIAEFSMAFNCVERIREYTIGLPCEAALVTDRQPSQEWPSQGILKVENLQLRYRPELSLVLRGLSFSTSPGERLGVVGRTGAGKSTLLLALLRIVEPEPGTVLELDGEDVLALGLRDLRRAIAMIPQDPVLFQETLRYNCDPFQQHSATAIWQALEEAQLAPWVRERGAHLSDEGSEEAKLNRLLSVGIKEGGQNLSAGQRQMVAIARAVLRSSKLVVLDEATASLDPATDAAIQLAIRRCFRGATSLTIAHRLQTIIDCDRIMVLSEGMIAECGPPDELKEKEGGIFRGMLDSAES